MCSLIGYDKRTLRLTSVWTLAWTFWKSSLTFQVKLEYFQFSFQTYLSFICMYIYSYSSHITPTCAEEGEDFHRLRLIYREYSKESEWRCGNESSLQCEAEATAARQSRLYDSLKQCCEPGDSSYGVIGQWLPSRIEDSHPHKDLGAGVVLAWGSIGYLPPKVGHPSTHLVFSFLLATIRSGF